MQLARKLGTFDATLIVIGGIIGSGIFMTPSLVAKYAQTPALMIGAWCTGAAIALLGAFIFAELVWRRPDVQGMYGYLREAFHPVVAFTAGWTGLLVSMTGGIAASAVTFATYFASLTPWKSSPALTAVAAIVILSAINCLGVREGGTTQNALMLVKGAAIVAIICAGLFGTAGVAHLPVHFSAGAPLALFGFALIPVLFAYDGWQTAPYLDRELKNPARALPRALLWGVAAVALLYVLTAVAGWRMLGITGLANSAAPASEIMRVVAGNAGVRFVSAAIAISTLGFMSNSILTAPRLYYAMARDGIFFRQLGELNRKTYAPVAGIAVQAVVAIAITLSGSYNQILAYVVAIDFVYFAAVGAALFVFRRRDSGGAVGGLRVPGHPWSSALFVLISAGVVVQTYFSAPAATLVGLGILLSGVPAYLFWQKRAQRVAAVNGAE